MLNTEYDRLAENIIDEYKDISKVVPYINKWVQFGTDVRNTNRLNNSISFGKRYVISLLGSFSWSL